MGILLSAIAAFISLFTSQFTTVQEVNFLSSDQEYSKLENGSRQQQIAQALYTGINNWFSKSSNSV